MAKLGSDKRPAVVRVRTMPKGEEIVALCERYHWKVIVGIEPDQPEDLSDIDLLLRGPAAESPAPHAALPLISTVQARHWPSPQPYFVPVSCRSSRSTSSSGRCGSVETVRDCPLTVNVIFESIRRV